MAKKKEEKLEEVTLVEANEEVSLLDKDFGREDLNELRDKINELIKRA